MPDQDPNAGTYRRVEALLLEAFAAAKRGEEANRHVLAYYNKIQPLLSSEIQNLLQERPDEALTAEKLRLELGLHFQRQTFLIHSVLFLDAYDRDLPEGE